MSKDIDDIIRAIDAGFDTTKALVKTLIIEHNNEKTNLLVESITKSQEIEKLKDKIKGRK